MLLEVGTAEDGDYRKLRIFEESHTMILRGRVPLRVSFCGGGTDVDPFCREQGGVVLSTTIDMYGYISIEPRDDNQICIYSLDYQTSIQYDVRSEVSLDGRLDLIKAVLSHLGISQGLNIFVHNDAPTGTGLGSSGALATLLVAMLARLTGRQMSRSEIADTALHVERDILKIAGGKQDQYAAAFGGLNFIEFKGDKSFVNPLRPAKDIINELEYHLLLVYTKKKHYSHDLIQTQIDLYKKADDDHSKALESLKELTYRMKDALVSGNIIDFGLLLHEAWVNKVKMNKRVTTDYINELYSVAREEGALGGKILGAGAGGYMLVFVPFQSRHKVARALTDRAAVVNNMRFVETGIDVWHTSRSALAKDLENGPTYLLSDLVVEGDGVVGL